MDYYRETDRLGTSISIKDTVIEVYTGVQKKKGAVLSSGRLHEKMIQKVGDF